MRPFHIIEDMGILDENPITAEMVEAGGPLIEDAKRKLADYQREHHLSSATLRMKW